MENVELEIAKKAYTIDFEKIEEGFLYDEDYFVSYAETRDKAKSELLKKAYCEDVCLIGENDEVTYLTIPIIRSRFRDKYLFEGRELQKSHIVEIQAVRQREEELSKIEDNKDFKYYYIMKKGGYYPQNKCGYVNSVHNAGVFSKEDALVSAKGCHLISLIGVDVNTHNDRVNRRIKELTGHLLPSN